MKRGNRMIMEFEQNKTVEKIGERVGYTFAYFLFTTILFFMLKLLGRIPQAWTYFHIMAITILITIIGYGVKRFLR